MVGKNVRERVHTLFARSRTLLFSSVPDVRELWVLDTKIKMAAVGMTFESEDGRVYVISEIIPRSPMRTESKMVRIPEQRARWTYVKQEDDIVFVNVRNFEQTICPLSKMGPGKLVRESQKEGEAVLKKAKLQVERDSIKSQIKLTKAGIMDSKYALAEATRMAQERQAAIATERANLRNLQAQLEELDSKD